jgi:hypothetical protein
MSSPHSPRSRGLLEDVHADASSYIHGTRSNTSGYISSHVTLITRPPFEYLSEEEALSFPPVTDHLLAANISLSKVYLADSTSSYTIGDTIRVNIQLFSGYNKIRTIGGDHIRVWMREESKKASGCGSVVDHDNGTYTASLFALWAGEPEVVVSLVYPREVIRYLYFAQRENPSRPGLISRFASGKYSEATTCQLFPFLDALQSGVCNLTGENQGMSFYCLKPRKTNLLCHDWAAVMENQTYPKQRKTVAEKKLLLL